MSSNGIDYDLHAASYPAQRCADPRIEASIHAALGDARTVLNVGAGAGSYEPLDRHVIAVEPSAGMRAQRPRSLSPAIAAKAEALPFDDEAVDAAIAIITIHHWDDPIAGLREMRRVTRGPGIVLTFDVDALERFWLVSDYLPEALENDRKRFPTIEAVTEALGEAHVETVPIPIDCRDGFLECHYARPEAYLDPAVRAAQSVWPPLPDGVEERVVGELAADLASGAWDERHRELRITPTYEGAVSMTWLRRMGSQSIAKAALDELASRSSVAQAC